MQGVNLSSHADVLALLAACDQDFLPRLSARVDLHDYAKKICRDAIRCEWWSDKRQLTGLVAIYCNTPDLRNAFITNVSVAASHRGRGIALKLLRQAILNASDRGYSKVELEVSVDSDTAIAIYRSVGFIQTKLMSGFSTMELEIDSWSDQQAT